MKLLRWGRAFLLRDLQAVPRTEAKKPPRRSAALDIVQEIESLVGRQALEDLDLEALELAARQQVLRLVGKTVVQRCGFREAERIALLGDGAPRIWNLAEGVFPGAIQIVDRFHAKQQRCQRHHRSALLQAQRAISGFLVAPSRRRVA